jgi:hypothetical protein
MDRLIDVMSPCCKIADLKITNSQDANVAKGVYIGADRCTVSGVTCANSTGDLISSYGIYIAGDGSIITGSRCENTAGVDIGSRSYGIYIDGDGSLIFGTDCSNETLSEDTGSTCCGIGIAGDGNTATGHKCATIGGLWSAGIEIGGYYNTVTGNTLNNDNRREDALNNTGLLIGHPQYNAVYGNGGRSMFPPGGGQP